VKIMLNQEEVGYLAIKLAGSSVAVYPSSAFPTVLQNLATPMVIELASNKYNAVNQYLGNSTTGAKGVALYQWEDDGGTFDPDETLLGGGELMGLEHAMTENGIGWKDANKMLLEFAAGNGMGDSTRFFQTYSTINL